MRELNGVAWYNDSKATNVDATLKAIDAFPGGLWVILGGKDKNSDYTPLAAPLKAKAHAASADRRGGGKDRRAIAAAPLPMIALRNLEAAVGEARARARPRRYRAARARLRQLRSVREFRASRPRIQTSGAGDSQMARLKTDWILFLTILAMVGFGMVMLYSASSAVAELRYTSRPIISWCARLVWAVVSFLVLMYFKRLRLPRAEHAGVGIFRTRNRAGHAGAGVFRRSARAPLVPDSGRRARCSLPNSPSRR